MIGLITPETLNLADTTTLISVLTDFRDMLDAAAFLRDALEGGQGE